MLRILREIDLWLLGVALVTVVLGVTMVYSAAYHSESLYVRTAWSKQAVVAVLATGVCLAVPFLPNRILYGLTYPLYGLVMLMLAAVMAWGHGEDAARWLDLGVVRFQPSEFAKLATVVALARYLADSTSDELNQVRGFGIAVAIVAVPMAMVVQQPDLGTAMALGAPLFPMVFWAGTRRIFLFCVLSPLASVLFSFEPLWKVVTPFVFAAFVITSAVLVQYLLSQVWVTVAVAGCNLLAGLVTVYLWDHFLLPYQQDRILIFLNPEVDRLGAGWNIIQSKIAIGSGGLTGKGFLEGTQTKYEFLPASHTDFIFSVIGEELGFIGTIAVLALFLFLVVRGLRIAAAARNRFHSLIAVGLASMLAFHAFVNIGMTIGVMPVTGIPLPFLSYGGTALLANMVGIGLLLLIHLRRHEY
ncbi:MAG: rod shape-determining protein RodA [Candidatus Latescibacterota bacterium]